MPRMRVSGSEGEDSERGVNCLFLCSPKYPAVPTRIPSAIRQCCSKLCELQTTVLRARTGEWQRVDRGCDGVTNWGFFLVLFAEVNRM